MLLSHFNGGEGHYAYKDYFLQKIVHHAEYESWIVVIYMLKN